ncbi:MAG: PQQ-binding-like beta-propeller repeat protein [Gemmatimonadales bacterium]|nr:PQQ-binding-like beta-propeller repeat protein [Gemmatimonadales bacterium]
MAGWFPASLIWSLSACAVFATTSVNAQDALPAGSPMFRGNPAHTGVSSAPFFRGQGGVKWSVRTGGPVRSSPAVTATRVFAGSADGFLYAVDRAAGHIVWRFEVGGVVDAAPAVAAGLVIVANDLGRIVAVDERTGRLRWSVRSGTALPSNTASRPRYDYEYFISSPVIVGRTVVIGQPDGGVYALDLVTGARRWRVTTGGKVHATPAVHDGLVVVGSFDGRVYGIDLGSGASRWVFRTAGDTIDLVKTGYDRRGIQSSAAIADGTIFLGSRDDGVYALDAATGAARWRASHRGSWVVGSPAVDGEGRVFVGSSDGRFVQALEGATGKELWRLRTGASMQASPLRVQDALVVGGYRTDNVTGDLTVLEAASGAIRWRLRLDGSILSSPVAMDEELYVGTDGGSIVAIHEANRLVPRLAVFYDSTHMGRPFITGGRLAFEYFRDLGYEPLGVDSLAGFLASRSADGVPSAVIFASDVLPPGVLAESGGASPLRRYLDAGGKVIWTSMPLGAAVRDSTGRLVATDFARAGRMLGVSVAGLTFNGIEARPTAVGGPWGVSNWSMGMYGFAPADLTEALAVDRFGQATAWVKSYRPDRPGSGYVQLFGVGLSLERLPMVRAAAEYGLLRRAR